MNHNVDVTDIVQRAIAQGRREALAKCEEMVCELANDDRTKWTLDDVIERIHMMDYEATKDAAIPSPVPDRATERCEWKRSQMDDCLWETGCGYTVAKAIIPDVCGECFRPISVVTA